MKNFQFVFFFENCEICARRRCAFQFNAFHPSEPANVWSMVRVQTTPLISHAIVRPCICARLLLVTVFERRAYCKNQVSVSTEAIPEIKAAKVAKRSPDGSRRLTGVTDMLAFLNCRKGRLGGGDSLLVNTVEFYLMTY